MIRPMRRHQPGNGFVIFGMYVVTGERWASVSPCDNGGGT
jgi:hypothetical protein